MMGAPVIMSWRVGRIHVGGALLKKVTVAVAELGNTLWRVDCAWLATDRRCAFFKRWVWQLHRRFHPVFSDGASLSHRTLLRWRATPS